MPLSPCSLSLTPSRLLVSYILLTSMLLNLRKLPFVAMWSAHGLFLGRVGSTMCYGERLLPRLPEVHVRVRVITDLLKL